MHAIPGGEHIRQGGAHRLIHGDRALDPEFGAGIGGQLHISLHADHDEHEINCLLQGFAATVGSHCEGAVGGAGDGGDGGVGEDLNAVAFQFVMDQGAQLGIDGRQHFG